jgi:dTDP-4-dehydrorhamnose reductase
MILITGSHGLLGKELLKHLTGVITPTHEEFDIVKDKGPITNVDLIVHCAAFTKVLDAETHRQECFDVNVRGTANLTRHKIPIVYISTEYVFDGEKGNYSEEEYPYPVNFYAYTKLLGEYECRRTEHVIVRTLFKSWPFRYDMAPQDQYTSGDYVGVIAPMIAWVVKNFNKCPSILHIGTEKKTIFDLARQSRKVRAVNRYQIPVKLPQDTSLNLTKWRSLYNG